MKTNVEALLLPYRRSLRQSCIRMYRKAITLDFVQKVAEMFATRVLLIAIGLITSVIVARTLGPEGRGLYALAVTIGTIGVQFGNLGLHASNTYYVARDRTLLPALVGNAIVISFAFGSLGIALTWIIFSLWPNLAPVRGLLLILSLTWVPFGLAYLLLQNLLLGIQEVRGYNKIELATKIVGVGLLGLVIFLLDVTVEKVFLAGLVTLVISFIWAFWRLKSYLVGPPIPSLALFKKHISYGLKAYWGAFFAFLVIRVDLLMVQYILGPEQTGYYSIAVSIADMLYALPIVIGAILFPKLSSMNRKREKWQFTKRVAIVTGVLVLSIIISTALLAEQIICLLFGKAFLPAVSPLIWLLPGILMLSLTSILSSYIASEYIPLVLVFLYFLIALLNIVLNWYLLPIFGIVGGAISSTISYCFIFAGILLISISIYSRHGSEQ